MGKQRRQRSWFRLLITSVIAGAGVAAVRSLLRPAAPATAPEAHPTPARVRESQPVASTPVVGLTKRSVVSEPVAPMSEPHSEPMSEPVDPASAPLSEPVFEAPVAPSASESVAVLGENENPQLAFVAEPTTPNYLPPTSQGSHWDPPTNPEWLPGFGATGPIATDPWFSSVGAPAAPPADAPPLDGDGSVSAVRGRFQEWRYHTPRRQMVFTILGTLCLIAAIVATVLVLAL